jgi:hypothetical protein
METEGGMRSSQTADLQYEGGSTIRTRGDQRLTTSRTKEERAAKENQRGIRAEFLI